MTAEVASASVALLPTFKGGAQAIQQQLGGPISQAGQQGGQAYGNGVLSTFTKFAAPIAGVFAGVKITEFFKDSAAAASDLNEAGAAGGEVFGKAFSAVEAYASNAATNLGQSKLQAIDAATTFGVYAQAAGLAEDARAEFSTGLVGLAGDLASFYNTSPEQAAEAIAAGLRGESEPLRQYGVLLDDATLRQKALELGIYDGNGALSQQQRVLAAQQAIMEQTSVAQGDFTRTSDGLANQQRILAAQAEDFKARFGEALLPLFSEVTASLNKDLFPALDGFLPIVQDIFSTGVPMIIETGKSLEPLISNGLKLAKNVLPVAGDAFIAVLDAGEPLLEFLGDLDPKVVIAAGSFLAFTQLRQPVLGMLDSIGTGIGKLDTPFDGLNSKLGNIPGKLGAVTSFLGGPWGTAIGLGIGVLTPLVMDLLPKAAANLDELTGSFDRNTGAITDNTRASAFKALQESGAVDAAKAIGIDLQTLTDAALGDTDALAQARALVGAFSASGEGDYSGSVAGFTNIPNEAAAVMEALSSQNDAVEEARQKFQDEQAALGVAVEAQQKFTDSVTAAQQALAANGITLDENTEQGQSNRAALQAIADQTDALIDSSTALGDASYVTTGKFSEARQSFIDTATQMGLPIDQAKVLADTMLSIPAQKVIDVQANTEGAQAALDAFISSNSQHKVTIATGMGGSGGQTAYAGGGTVFGPGTSKSDSILARLSVGEEVIQEPHASRHRALLKAINSGLDPLNGPRFASGGTAGGNPTATVMPSGLRDIGITVVGVEGQALSELARIVKNELRDELRDELRTAG